MSLKKLLINLVLILLFLPQILLAQQNREQCATVYADSVLRAKHSDFPSKKEFENWLAPKVVDAKMQRTLSGRFSGSDVYTIPVIVHIIHNGDAVGSNENISQAQVYSQIEVLNRDFRRLNPDTANAPAAFQAVAADVGIEFCLAQVDPNGNILTEAGINRVNAGRATWSDTDDIDNDLKPATVWDPNRYFNIWVVNFGNTGLLGYAQFPSTSGLAGMPGNGGPADTDGIVCYYRGFGTIGSATAPSNGGRTATHEAGHWFGLRHIWGDGGCGVDDFCNDTPESDASNRGCSTTSSCGSQDMVQNYMDYTNDACMNIFTADQVARMRAVMQNSPRRGVLANSTVCQVLDEYTISGKVRDATSLVGIAGASVSVRNNSYNYAAITDAQGNFSIDVFEGVYDVYAGKWTFITNVNAGVSVLANTGPVYVDLEEGYYDDFIFDFNWTESGDATTGNWERDVPTGTFYNNLASNPGQDVPNDFGEKAYVTGNGGGDAGIDDIDGGTTVLTSPVFDLSSYTEPYISYYRWFFNDGGTGTPNDSLVVEISNGINTVQVEFLDVNSANSNQWNFNQFQVSSFIQPTANMQIIFRSADLAPGHLVEAAVDLFQVIDSVNSQNALPVANFSASPRTICAGESVDFTDISRNSPDAWLWLFPGGNPPSSTLQNPSVTYDSPGSYNVELRAFNPNGSDTLLRTAYVTVEGIEAAFTADVKSGCPGVQVKFKDASTCGTTSWLWTFPGGNPPSSTQQNPVVSYNSLGDFDVSLQVSKGQNSDSFSAVDFISVSTGAVNVFFEDFESDDFTTNAWTLDNADNAMTWEIFTVGGSQSGNKAAGMNFFNYQNAQGEADAMITPVLNLTNISNSQLSFEHAFRRYSQNERDSLKILVSTDGGATYPNLIFARSEDGTGTFATNTTTTNEFYPAIADDWCFSGGLGASCFSLDLSAFDNESALRIKFLAINDFGNNLFIDNISIDGVCSILPQVPVADFSANLLSGCAGLNVDFTDLSTNLPTAWNWTFAGGNPPSSTDSNPSVLYTNSGIFPVKLWVSNAQGSDSILQTAYIHVFENPNLNFNENPLSCYAASDASLSANSSAGTAPFSYSWNTGASGNTLNTISAGTYSVTVVDDNSCVANASFVVNNPDSLTLTLSGSNSSCGQANASANAQLSGGTPPYAYSWSNGINTAAISNIVAGTYLLTVTDANNCSKIASITLQDSPVVFQSNAQITDAACGNSNGSISLNMSGGTAPYTYAWSTNATGSSISSLSFGNYQVTLSDANSCAQVFNFTVNNIGGPSVQLAVDSISCNAAMDGQIAVESSGGTAPYTLTWSNAQQGDTLKNLGAGTYSLSVSDANGCSTSQNITLMDPPAIHVLSNIVNNTCGQNNGQIDLTISNGLAPYQVDWNTGANGKSISNLASGNYSSTVSDAQGCTVVENFVVSNTGGLSVSLQSNDISCAGAMDGRISPIFNTGTAPFTLLWSNGATTQNLSGLDIGNYSLTVTDVNNCVAVANTSITSPDSLAVSFDITGVRCGQKYGKVIPQISGGVAPFQFLWSNASSDSIFEPLAGVYGLTITDASACKLLEEVYVPYYNLDISVVLSPDSGQGNGSVEFIVNGGNPPYSYFWQNTNLLDSNFVGNLSGGSYSVLVKDSLACDTLIQVTVPFYTKLGELLPAVNFALYPNPNEGEFILRMDDLNEPLQYRLIDMFGKQIDAGEIAANTAQQKFRYPQMAAGIYFLHLKNKQLDSVQKLLIRH